MRICDVCEEACNDVHGIQFSDKFTRYEAKGHKNCIDERYEQIKRIKEGKTVQAVLKKLNL
jgi:hypothetical protein